MELRTRWPRPNSQSDISLGGCWCEFSGLVVATDKLVFKSSLFCSGCAQLQDCSSAAAVIPMGPDDGESQ